MSEGVLAEPDHVVHRLIPLADAIRDVAQVPGDAAQVAQLHVAVRAFPRTHAFEEVPFMEQAILVERLRLNRASA